MKERDFFKDLTNLINRYSFEKGSDTPDFILSTYIQGCLVNFNEAVNRREEHYGRQKPVLETSLEKEVATGEIQEDLLDGLD